MTHNQENNLVSSISAKELPILKILGGDYIFEIPHYQRPYSWKEDNAIQLLEDISHFALNGSDLNQIPPYFLGSLVIIKKYEERLAKVVDGQQRLTTLTILLSCLRKKISDQETKNDISSLIFQKGSVVKGTADNYRIKIRERDQEYFNKLIQVIDGLNQIESLLPDNNSDSQGNVHNNANAYFEIFEEKEYTESQLIKLASFIIQRCFLVIVSSTEEESAFRIFNVLNDRGMQLTTADILKSEIIEKIPKDEQELYNTKWEDCEESLGQDSFKDLFSHIRTIYAKKKAEEGILKEIRTYLNPAANPKNFVDNILEPFASAFSNIISSRFQSHSYANEINKSLKYLNLFSHKDWVPPTVVFMSKNMSNPQLILNFLLQMERLTLGLEIMRTYLNSRLKRYSDLISLVEKGGDVLKTNETFFFKNWEKKKIVEGLTTNYFYGKRFVKNVLLKLDESYSDGSATYDHDIISIEHVLPRNPAKSSDWYSKFNDDQRETFTNQLGNLVLLSFRKNARAKNYDFQTKFNQYFKKDGVSSFVLTMNLQSYTSWTPEIIEKRTKELTNDVLEILKIPEFKVTV